MKALMFDGNRLEWTLNEPVPVVPEGEALIKVLVAGICNTDIEITKGYMHFSGILGHEFVGVVEAINDNDQSLLGKRVVGDINCSCRRHDCEYCQKGLGRHCPGRTTLGISGRNGCMAEYVVLPVVNLFEVPGTITDELAVLTEPLAAGFEILEQINLSSQDEVLIVGDGKLGLLVNHAVSTSGASITHVGKHPEKLELARLTGSQVCFPDDKHLSLYDVVIEATGNQTGFMFSLQHTKPRGKLILKSTFAGEQHLDLVPVVVNEITIVGSRCGLFGPALAYLNTGADLTPLISASYPADRTLEAFDAARSKGSLKVLVDFRPLK